MSDLSSRKRKRERRIKGQDGGDGGGGRAVEAAATQNLLGLSTDLIGFLVENWPRGKQQRVLILL